MTIFENIDKNYLDFSKTEKKIGDFIISNYSTLAFITLDVFASKCGVSTTSVIRFARKLGFSGYVELQNKIRRSLMKKVSLPERFENKYPLIHREDLLSKMLESETKNLQNTFNYLTEDSLKKSLELISGAHKIYVLGSRSTFGVAYYTSNYLSQIIDNVSLISGVGGMYPEELVNIDENDVCIAYMFPRYQQLQANMLSWFKTKHVPVIVITCPDYEAIKHLGDVFLCCDVQSIMPKDTMIPAMFISNYLIANIAAENYPKTQISLKNMEDILEKGLYLGL